VIFGASGDLTQRKLIPSLFSLYCKDRMPKTFRIVGYGGTDYNDDSFRVHLAEAMKQFSEIKYTDQEWNDFASHVVYVKRGYTLEEFKYLNQFLDEWQGEGGNRLFYMATPPDAFPNIIDLLGKSKQLKEEKGWRRVVIEKPFGTDLVSAEKLNHQIHKVLNEKQIYRIDHYLGKETVQNILVARFANTIFEPLWNRNYIDHVEITVAEKIGVEHRGKFYDTVGILRDIFQNHLLQLLTLVAMEPPVAFEASALRNEKVKVLSAIMPMSEEEVTRATVRGQYEGYRQEEGVDPNSNTATYGATRLYVNNWRWQGVPFYLRSGKYLPEKLSQITIEFKCPPHLLFPSQQGEMTPNMLVLYLQPDEGIHWRFVPRSRIRWKSCARWIWSSIMMRPLEKALCRKPMSVSCWMPCWAMRPCSPVPMRSRPPGALSIRSSRRGSLKNRLLPSTRRADGGRKNQMIFWPAMGGAGPCGTEE
jgi:glucose-6-phosphate 1-dehydrogenase